MVRFGDTEISETLRSVYETGGVVIYFGFDVPVTIEETENAELSEFVGTINVFVKTK